MTDLINKIWDYLVKRIGMGSLILFSIFIYSLINDSFIANMPFINKMMLDEKQFKSVVMLLLLIVWIYFLKAGIQLLFLFKSIYFDDEKFVKITAKRMIFCGWGFLILFTLSNKGDWSMISGGLASTIAFFPVSMSLALILGASIWGRTSISGQIGHYVIF